MGTKTTTKTDIATSGKMTTVTIIKTTITTLRDFDTFFLIERRRKSDKGPTRRFLHNRNGHHLLLYTCLINTPPAVQMSPRNESFKKEKWLSSFTYIEKTGDRANIVWRYIREGLR